MDVIEIFKKLQSGEESAFNDFYNKTVKLVFYVIENVGVPRADIEDVAQEVYIQVFKHYKDVKNPDSVLSWIKQIAKTRAINHQVKYSKETVVYDEASDIVFEESEFLAPMDLPEDVMESKESRRIINDIVNKLPEKQSLVFRAFYFNEMKTKEISESISMPEGTVKVYLKRSRDFVQNEVLAFTKKHGVKIASMAIVPVFGMIFTEEANACAISTSTLSSVYKGAMTVAKGASVKAAAASKAMAGLTKALATKIAVAVIGVAAIGGGTVAIVSNMNAQKSAEEQQLEASRAEEASRLEKEEEEKRQSEEASRAEELKKQEETLLAEAKTKSEEETKKKLEEQQKQVSTAENGGAVKPHEETPASTPQNNGPTPPPGARSNIRANIPDWSWWQAEHRDEVSAWIENYQFTHYHMEGETKVPEYPTWAEINQAAARGEMGVAEEKYYWY